MTSAAGGAPIKVLTLVDKLVAGGGERFAVDLTCHLDPSRFERSICSTRFPTDQAERRESEATLTRLEDAGVRVLGLSRGAKWAAWEWRPLVSLLRRERIDVLHAHKFGSNVWGTLLGRGAGVPVVISHEQTWSWEGEPMRRMLDRFLIARHSDLLIAVSEEDRRRMVEVEGIPKSSTAIVRNAVPRSRPEPARDVRTELGLGPEDPVVLTIAMLRGQKALDVLIRAAALLAPRYPGLAVLIAGGQDVNEPEVPPQLEALIDRLRLRGTVRLLGRRSDGPDLIAAADVTALSSDYEGTPLAVMEYMEGGRPVASTRAGGVPELIDDGVHGFIVEPRDPEALAGAIARLLDDPERAKAMGARGRERWEQEFDIEVTTKRVEGIYSELVEATRRAAGGG